MARSAPRQAFILRDYPYPRLLSAPVLAIVDIDQLIQLIDVRRAVNGDVGRQDNTRKRPQA